MAKNDDVTQTDILLQIAQTLASVQGQAKQGQDVGAALDKMTQTLAELATRTRPENPEHNGISAYSYPEGDFKHPKEAFKCEFFWCGYPLPHENHTPQEIAALNSLQPGEYRVTKGNGNQIPFTVEGKRKQNGELSELWVRFPCKGDQSTDHRSLVDYCKEAMGEKIPNLTELMAELQKMKAENASLQAVVANA